MPQQRIETCKLSQELFVAVYVINKYRKCTLFIVFRSYHLIIIDTIYLCLLIFRILALRNLCSKFCILEPNIKKMRKVY